ncbi:MAG: 3-isopropylmalate dehydratase [Sphingobacteriaceae bacterium]|nr:3-isopropylmalate dehydratase [Sphingobacteriaceae bacterium]
MKITDKSGRTLQVTNLDEAMKQAQDFKDRHHLPPQVGDKERQAYWIDLYQKLLTLKSRQK